MTILTPKTRPFSQLRTNLKKRYFLSRLYIFLLFIRRVQVHNKYKLLISELAIINKQMKTRMSVGYSDVGENGCS